MLAVYGDFDAGAMKQKLETLFAAWTVNQAPVPAFLPVKEAAAPGVYLAEKADVTQTFFAVGHLGGVLSNKDYPALEVTSQILGGGFSSRLFQRIRTKLGYAYGINASWGAQYDHPGLFEISGSTQSAHTVDTLWAVREELDKVRTAEVTTEELQTAKDTVLNGFVFNFDRPSKTLNRLLRYEYYGYPKDFIFQYQKAIAAVTKADVLRVAKQYLKPEDLTIVAVGNPASFGTPLKDLGLKIEPIDLTIPQPKKAVNSNPASAAKGKELLKKLQAALGGEAKLAAVKDVQAVAEVAIQTGGAAMKATQRNSLLLPSMLRQDTELPFGKQSVFFDGTAGWMANAQGSQPLPPPVIKQVQGELFRQWSSLASGGNTVSAVDANTIEIADAHGNQVRLQVDTAGKPVKLFYEGEGMAGPSNIEETFADWRDVDGMSVPFQITILQGGKKFADVKVQQYKVNSGLSAAQLSKKP